MTNQSNGILSLLLFPRVLCLGLIVRLGYRPWILYWRLRRYVRFALESVVGLLGLILADRLSHTEPVDGDMLLAVAKSKLRRIRNAVHVPQLETGVPSRIEDRKTDILFVGRISPEKRILEFVESLLKLSPDHRVRLIGSFEARHEAYVQRTLQSPNVDYLGRQNQTIVFDEMANAKTLVLPSVSEGVPKVALEACAFGCLPVMTSFPFAREHFSELGLVVDAFEEFPSRVVDLLGDVTRAQALQQACLRLSSFFSVEEAVRTEVSVIAELSRKMPRR